MDKETEIRTRLAPEFIVVSTAAFIVAISWSNFFNTLFENLAQRYDTKDNGPVELALRLSFAALLTVLLVILGRTYLHMKQKAKLKNKPHLLEKKNKDIYGN